jgi:hypothetical protein
LIHYIYTLTDPIDNLVKYIGRTKNIKQRYYTHTKNSKDNTPKNNWIKSLKNNELKPIIEILDEGDETNIDDLEIYWISQFKTWGFDLKNWTSGGEFYNTYWKGKNLPEYMISKIKNTFQNKNINKPVVQYSIKTNVIINEYFSIKEASKMCHLTDHHISACCKGIKSYNTVGGYYWRFKDNYFPLIEIQLKYKIQQFDINFIFIKQFNSKNELINNDFSYKKIVNADKFNIVYENSYWKIIRN